MAELLLLEATQRAQGALQKSPIHALRDLRVDREGDSILISGRVDTFYHKQLAQELVNSVAREARIVNTVSVN